MAWASSSLATSILGRPSSPTYSARMGSFMEPETSRMKSTRWDSIRTPKKAALEIWRSFRSSVAATIVSSSASGTISISSIGVDASQRSQELGRAPKACPVSRKSVSPNSIAMRPCSWGILAMIGASTEASRRDSRARSAIRRVDQFSSASFSM